MLFYTFNMYLNDFKDMKNLIYFFLFKFDFSAGVILQHIHILVIKLKKNRKSTIKNIKKIQINSFAVKFLINERS